jgi:hypothetical protein
MPVLSFSGAALTALLIVGFTSSAG